MELSPHTPIQDRTLEVLKFWHCVEFFVPFDLDNAFSEPSTTLSLTEAQLTQRSNYHLPWLSEISLNKAGGVAAKKYRYNLYLLPFDKSALTRISKEIFSSTLNHIETIEFEEKLDDEGQTCFAKLSLDNEGQFSIGNMSVSTLPWALGRLNTHNLDELNHKHYEQEQKKLIAEINTLDSHLYNSGSAVISDYAKPGVLTASALYHLLTLFKASAKFNPDDPISLIIETIEIKENETKESKRKNEENRLKSNIKQQGNRQLLLGGVKKEEIVDALFEPIDESNLPSTLDNNIDENTAEEKYKANADEPMDILNSFYIQDLEKVINDFDRKIISSYINGSDENGRIDLNLTENSHHITEKLESDYSNHGSWPRESGHFLSLMQQFAVNESFYLNNKKSLFSVNGPPGTGKTTLLQDIVAENIVKRARVLSSFQNSCDAFTDRKTVTFPDMPMRSIALLDERLTGFEMLVASSNNAAIENISKELPLIKKIDGKYQKACRYFRPVARKVFSEHRKDGLKSPPEKNSPWGLVAAALGNSKNCKRFQERVFFPPKETVEKKEERLKAGQYLTIWEWKKQYKGSTFHEAKSFFTQADKAVQNYLENIKQCFDLHKKVSEIDADNYLKERTVMLAAANLVKNKLDEKKNEEEISLRETKKSKEETHFAIKEIIAHRPNFLHLLFRTKKYKDYRNRINKLEHDWNYYFDKERFLKKEIEKITLKLKEVDEKINIFNTEIEEKEKEYNDIKKNYCDLLEQLEGIILPPSDGNLDNDKVQFQAFWQNGVLNALRANLYIAALALHEAWLFESLENGNFIGNLFSISNLLSNKRPVEKSSELYIWQSLFMWVPVVSCTFASIARQFKNIDAESLGWLLIDEAGQATPQSAVGAMWRAKHVLVIGDPLQIEPVFTISPNLVEGLAKHILKQDYEKWLPTLASVQTLADDANTMGTYVNANGKEQWIGCPLRIHRRCLEPMFSVANQIAYNNKMINARSADLAENDYPLGASAWYDILGKTIDRQYVAEQGDCLLRLFATLYNAQRKLPNLYIITPFKRIKARLKELILDTKKWESHLTNRQNLPFPSELKKWCDKHIGTVHTFQGKESETVIFVLGVDEDSQGSADWASSKPNLLNVALTRAQNRIYLIGDYELWSRKKYFSQLSSSLPLAELDCLQ